MYIPPSNYNGNIEMEWIWRVSIRAVEYVV